MLSWPPEHSWPAVDLLKALLRSSAVQAAWLGGQRRGGALMAALEGMLEGGAPVPALLCALRCLANLSHGSASGPLADTAQLLSALATLLLSCSDEDAQRLTCQAPGTLLVRGAADVTAFAKALDLSPALSGLVSAGGKARGCAGDLLALLG